MEGKVTVDVKTTVVKSYSPLFPEKEMIGCYKLNGMSEPNEKQWYVTQAIDGQFYVLVPDRNSDVFYGIPNPENTKDLLAIVCVHPFVNVNGKVVL
ncbi:hypothetical protein ACULX1_001866 [Escherichia coli]